MPALQQGWISPSVDPQHPNWRYEIVADPQSPTGWSRRVWNPIGAATETDTQPYDFARDQAIAGAQDAQAEAGRQAYAASSASASAAESAKTDALANEDRSRFDINQGNLVASRQQVASEAQKQRDAAVRAAKLLADENHRQFDLNFGLDQRKQAASELATAAGMRGPLDAFQGAEYARGISNMNGGIPSYLQSLQGSGTTTIGGGTATQGNPTPLTPATLGAQLGAGGGGQGSGGYDAYGRPLLSPDYQQKLGAISTIAQNGLANLGQGAIENMSDSERKTFTSGLDYLGRDSGSEMQMYQRSRPGQGLSSLG